MNDNYLTNFSTFLSKIITTDISINNKKNINIDDDKNLISSLKEDKIALFKNYHTVNKPKSFHLQ